MNGDVMVHAYTVSKLRNMNKSLDFKSVLPLVMKYLMIYMPIYITCYGHAKCNPCSRHTSMFVGSVVNEREAHFGNNTCKATLRDMDNYKPDDSDCFTFTEWDWYNKREKRAVENKNTVQKTTATSSDSSSSSSRSSSSS